MNLKNFITIKQQNRLQRRTRDSFSIAGVLVQYFIAM